VSGDRGVGTSSAPEKQPEGAVVRVFHRTGVARLIDRTRCEQFVQLCDLGRVALGCAADRRQSIKDSYVNLHHLEWLLGEPVPDPAMVVYEVRPYAPAQADRIIERLCMLAKFKIDQADDDPAGADRVRRAFGHIVDGARTREALLDLQAIEREIGRPPWRDLLKELRHDRSQFTATIRDRSACIALRWALRDLGLANRAGRRWLHYLRDNHGMLRKAIDRAVETALLQRDGGRTERADRVLLVEGVGRAYELLTGKSLGRSLTAEQRPSGPGLRLVRLCLVPLDPLVTDDAIVWAMRRVQARSCQVIDSQA
jgi:hypothetical protein